ncbi:hypothetical protein [Salicibibacter kimchii]|uniref:Uncharacterized protein n=1 Tax=Salicibibacter kimchii TaxID=2099786 RepID=A0A345BUW7_9BACI|nr:hypothetical protein [Salicibibacter kimchii]AXF54748.1 hypothetical protein DT065_01070 [Salicibibacter kimchii]
MLEPFDNLLSSSDTAFTVFIAIGTILAMISLFTYASFMKKINFIDGDQNVIKLKIEKVMSATLLFSLFVLLFIAPSESDIYRQYFLFL